MLRAVIVVAECILLRFIVTEFILCYHAYVTVHYAVWRGWDFSDAPLCCSVSKSYFCRYEATNNSQKVFPK